MSSFLIIFTIVFTILRLTSWSVAHMSVCDMYVRSCMRACVRSCMVAVRAFVRACVRACLTIFSVAGNICGTVCHECTYTLLPALNNHTK